MKRRQLLCVVGGAAAWAVSAQAQQRAPVIGFLNSRPESEHFMALLRQGLRESGYVNDVIIDYRSSDGRNDRLPALAADLVRRQVALIFAGGGPAAAVAAKAATSTTPIVFIGGSDPVAIGLVASINRPGGNITGVLNIASTLTAKRLELLREFAPTADVIAVIHNPNYPEARTQLREIEEAVRTIGMRAQFFAVSGEADFEPALADVARQGAKILFFANDPYLASQRDRLTALAARHSIPAAYAQREYAEAGGLMSYGTNFADLYRQGGVYAGRILKGERPADLPVMQPSRFELVVNLKTARALKIEMPAKILALADEVIE